MSLVTWLPLISNTKNQGLSNPTITEYGTFTYSAGKLGTAPTFTNHAIAINPAPINTNTPNFSFAFWLKTTNAGATQCIYNGRTSTGGPVSIFLYQSKWRLDDGDMHPFSTGAIANEWHHYAFTRDESNIKYYKDGVLMETLTSTAFTLTPKTASIGRSSANGSTPSGNVFLGQLQDYRIYDHTLSEKEVKEISKGLVMHLPLDWSYTDSVEYADPDYDRLKIGEQYLTDCSGYLNTVTPYGSNITSCSSPRYTTGTTCGASSCINLGKSIKLQPPFSFAFWFNTSNLESGKNRLISCTETGGWSIKGENTGLSLLMYTNSGYKYCESITPRTELVNGWHHLVGTYDGYKSQLYIDGILENEVVHFTEYTNTKYNANNAVFLGAEATSSDTTPSVYDTPTSFSDFRFYATILSAEDVQQVYKIPFSIDHTGKFYGISLTEV